MKYVKSSEVKVGDKVWFGIKFEPVLEVAHSEPTPGGNFSVSFKVKDNVFTYGGSHQVLIEEAPIPAKPVWSIRYTNFNGVASATLEKDGVSVAYGPWVKSQNNALSALLSAVLNPTLLSL